MPAELAGLLLLRIDELAALRGWDQPATLWGLRWFDDSPALTALLDQSAARVRDELEAPPGTVAGAALQAELLQELRPSPHEALVGVRAPAELDAVALVTEGWDYPDDVKRSGVLPDVTPAEHPGRVEVRLVMLADRSGGLHMLRRPRGGAAEVLGDGGEGRVPDALRRVLGLPTSPPPQRAAALAARSWLRALAEEQPPLRWDRVRELDPAASLLAALATTADEYEDTARGSGDEAPPPPGAGSFEEAATGQLARAAAQVAPEDEPALRTELARRMGDAMSWEAIRQRHLEDTKDQFERTATEWMDAAMFARTVLGQSAGSDALLGLVRERHGEELAARLADELEARGWAEAPAPARIPSGPHRTLPDAPCSCGSGETYARCHGRPVPYIVKPEP